MLILEECISNDKALHLNALRVYNTAVCHYVNKLTKLYIISDFISIFVLNIHNQKSLINLHQKSLYNLKIFHIFAL